MENKIKWETGLDAALALAQAENKPILLDFFNAGYVATKVQMILNLSRRPTNSLPSITPQASG
jgi:hypothetical protein